MKIPHELHAWNLPPQEAIRVQEVLRAKLDLTWDGRHVDTLAGIDISVRENKARAAIVLLNYPGLEPIETATAEMEITFPYIPGLLAFREGPVILKAWECLQHRPDLLMFDGQGIAHPRGIGIAAMIGLWLETPSIGVAKSHLFGRYEMPAPERGDSAQLVDPKDPEKVIGVVLRSKANTNPLFVSPGDHIDVTHAAGFTLACCTTYRLPEPTRWAHIKAGERS